MECFAVAFKQYSPTVHCAYATHGFTQYQTTHLRLLKHMYINHTIYLPIIIWSFPNNIPLCSGDLSSSCAGCSLTAGLGSLTVGLLRASISLFIVGAGLVRCSQYRNTSLRASSSLSLISVNFKITTGHVQFETNVIPPGSSMKDTFVYFTQITFSEMIHYCWTR